MQCPSCQHENPAGVKFCGECGARLEALCPACSAANPPGNRFCHHCGESLGGDAAAAKSPSPPPESYTPRHLAERILTSRAALEGERKQVTVLFADLKGSMELLADRDPEEARKLLDPVLEQMMEAVHRYEGTVNQVMGDGIMALFGAPLAHEDHAVRACYAALRMQEQVARYAEDARRAHGVNLQIRVGLNSGEVVVRAIGSDLHMDYSAIGQTTHLAARMEQLASPGSVLLTPATLELVEGFVAVKSLGPVPVKGLAEAVEVYEVTGAGPARTRLQAAAGRGLTRCVGRDAEMAQLRRLQQLAGDSHGQVAAIVAEAGVGKSRLVHEFTHSNHTRGWLVLEGVSVSYGKATSYLPVIDLLKGYFAIQDRDELGEIRAKVTSKLLTLDRALEPTLPALLALLDVPIEDAAWSAPGGLDPAQRRQQMLDAVRRLLVREAREQPLLLIFEDLHWIDGETQALLDSLVESLGSARLLLLVNYRPEYQHTWSGKTFYSQLRLDALPAASAGELLDALLGDDPGLAPLKQLLVRRGNPFFLEETIRTLVETKALAGERGRYQLTQPVRAIRVPPTVQAMLAARIDRLAPGDKRLLQTASVVGKDVPFVLLEAITVGAQGLAPLPAGLDRLQAAEFLYETGLYPELEYSFKHALTYEVTYGSLLQERRRELHARVVEAIETLHRYRLSEQIERLAHHAERGEVWEKALPYLRQAGEKALARAAYREAEKWFERALATLRLLPETLDTSRQAIDLRVELRNALFPLGELQQGLDHLLEAERLAQVLGDQRRLARVSIPLSSSLTNLGSPDRGAQCAQRAVALASNFGDLGLQVAATFYLALAHQYLGDYRQGAAYGRRNAAALQGDLQSERFGLVVLPASAALYEMAGCLAELGEFAEAITAADEAIRIAEVANHRYSLTAACAQHGLVYLLRGELPQAIRSLERSLEQCHTWNIPIYFSITASRLGLAYVLSGRAAEGLPLLEQAAAKVQSLGHLTQQAPPLIWLVEAQLLAGRPDQAPELARRALQIASQAKQRGRQAWALRLLGEIHAQRHPLEVGQGEGYYRQALALAEELGMRPLVAHCHLGLGKLYRRTDQREQAHEHLSTAAMMYRDMDMRYWLTPAEAELRELA